MICVLLLMQKERNMFDASKYIHYESYQLIILLLIITYIINCDHNIINSNLSYGKDLCYQKLDNNSHWQIFTNNIFGTNEKNISNNPDNDCYDPKWSPDGQYIAFRWDKSVGGCDIYLYDIFSDSLMNLTTDLTNTESASLPEWTPDGEKIVYTQRNNDISYQFMMNKNGSDKRKLPAWVSFFYNDSYHFIYKNDEDNKCYKTDIDGNINECILDKEIAGVIRDFNPFTEEIIFTENIINTEKKMLLLYSIKTGDYDTLVTTEEDISIFQAFFSNDYLKIGFDINNSRDRLYILSLLEIKSGLIEVLVIFDKDEDEWFDYHSMVFSPGDTYLAYSKNVYQEGDWVWWKSYLYVVDIKTKEIKFIDEGVAPQWNPLLSF